MGMAAADNMDSGINQRLSQLLLGPGGVVGPFHAPVDQGNDQLGTLPAHGLHGSSNGFWLCLKQQGKHADLQPAFCFHHPIFVLKDPGNPGFLQKRVGIFQSPLAVIPAVVVGKAHHIHTALGQDGGIGRIPLEGKAVFLGDIAPGTQNAFKIAQGQVVLQKEFRHVLKGVAVVRTDHGREAVGAAGNMGIGSQGQVADEA